MDEQLKPVFDQFDTSGDGTISKEELGKAIGMAGKTPPDPKIIDALFNQIDLDGKGSLTFEEFKQFIMSLPPPVDAMKALFDQMDTDGSGTLSKEELQKLMEASGQKVPEGMLDDIINDIGGEDGKVSFEDFCYLVEPPE